MSQITESMASLRRLPAAALDVGRARIGLAHTDARAEVALAAEVLHRKGTRQDLAWIVPWLGRVGARVCVVGLPPTQEGDSGDSARLCRQFATALALAWPTGAVWLVDEADTTAEAHAELRLLGRSASQRRREVDRFAAKQILDRWLAGGLAEPVAREPVPATEPAAAAKAVPATTPVPATMSAPATGPHSQALADSGPPLRAQR